VGGNWFFFFFFFFFFGEGGEVSCGLMKREGGSSGTVLVQYLCGTRIGILYCIVVIVVLYINLLVLVYGRWHEGGVYSVLLVEQVAGHDG